MAKFIAESGERRKFKQIADAPILFCLFVSLFSGLNSLNQISKGSEAKFSRSVLENFLDQDGLPRNIRRYIKSLIKKMKRGKMIHLKHVKGKIIASVDGVETYRKKYSPEDFFKKIVAGLIDTHSQIAVHRNSETKEVEYFEVYRRLVVISLITDRGPMPMAWAFQKGDAGTRFLEWINAGKNPKNMPNAKKESIEKLKQEGELTVLKKLLTELKEDFGRSLPFEVLIGDGLYDKASILEITEKYNISLIAVQKDEKRTLRKDAAEDFSTRTPDKTWGENNTEYEGWLGVYEDENINLPNKMIKIIRVLRRSKKIGVIDNFFYCSNHSFITPRFVEWCRHYRWKEENGFNAWTNHWKLLKHEFHHTSTAADSIIGLIFTAIILVENYRRGNLNRGKEKHRNKSTLKLFFREIVKSLEIKNRHDFMKFQKKYLPPQLAPI